MKNAILVHGWAHKDEFYDTEYPTLSNSHWFPWISKQLMVRDIYTVAVEMPEAYYPRYSLWKEAFERFEINDETMLVGHSCGAGFLVRWLSENKDKKVGKVVLVAPWMGIDPDQEFDNSFFEFSLNSNIASQTKGLVIFHSMNDVQEIEKSVNLLRAEIKGTKYREFKDRGHFTLHGMGTEEFPELLEELTV